jgi:hypothetical protein
MCRPLFSKLALDSAAMVTADSRHVRVSEAERAGGLAR